MAPVMRSVADTHAAIWYLWKPENLSRDAVQAMDDAFGLCEHENIPALAFVPDGRGMDAGTQFLFPLPGSVGCLQGVDGAAPRPYGQHAVQIEEGGRKRSGLRPLRLGGRYDIPGP